MEIRKANTIYHKSFGHKLQSIRSNDPNTFWTMIHKKNKRVTNDTNETVSETCSDSFVFSDESNNLSSGQNGNIKFSNY